MSQVRGESAGGRALTVERGAGPDPPQHLHGALHVPEEEECGLGEHNGRGQCS